MGAASGVTRSAPASVRCSWLHPKAVAGSLIVFSLFCCSAAVEAKNWSINPGIVLSETYSDNVAPDTAGFDEADFVTQINPELQAALNGRRIQADLDYRMQHIRYARNNESSTFHQYLARAGAEILPEHFFIDASSSLTQRGLNTGGVRTRNNYTITDNRTDQFTASIRPSWHQSLGSHAEALLDYEHGIVRFDDDDATGSTADSQLDAASLTLNSLPGAGRLSWKFRVQGQHIDYDDNAFDDLKLRNAGVLLGYRMTPGLSPLALIGYEDNDFGSRLSSTDPKDSFWALGFRWQPNARSELEALAGHRFFGDTYRVNWTQRGRYLTSGLTYSEQINGEATSALEGVSLIDNPGGYSGSSLGVTGDVFLSKTARASVRFEKSRTSITITPFYTKRKFENSSQDESVGGFDGSWEWAFAPRTTFTLNLHWDKTDSSDDDNQTFTWTELQLERQLGKQATASIEYAYTESDSDDKEIAYTENAITVQLAYHFGTPARKTPELPSRRSRKHLRDPRF